jgi:hypothetical protein
MAEVEGIPSFVMTREGFADVVNNSFAGVGLPSDGPKHVFPAETFLAESDLSPINENIDKIVYGLTKWEPKIKAKGIYSPQKLTVTGKDYREAFLTTNELFLKNLWADGLPQIPPTEEQVKWMLTGTDLSPDTLVARILPAGGLATAEAIAINAVMAGCRPEYMPVLIAAVEAMTDPAFMLQSVQATTSPITPAFIVNGPIRKQLDINCSSGLLGPGWKANATIGRALRFILMNIGGAFPGITTMSTQGQPGRYTMLCGENEEKLPPGWLPFHVERGFSKDTSTVTVVGCCSLITSGYGGLLCMAEAMKSATQNATVEGPGTITWIVSPEDATTYILPGVDVKPPLSPMPLKVDPCPTKKWAREYLWENSKITFKSYLLSRRVESIARGHFLPKGEKEAIMKEYQNKLIPQVQSPDKILIFLGGGPGIHSQMMTDWASTAEVIKPIKLPKNWNQLLKEAKPHVREPFT